MPRFLNLPIRALLALGALLLIAQGPAGAPSAQAAKETRAEARRRIIKERRPQTADVQAARELIDGLSPDFRRLANTLRALTHVNPKFKLETRYQDDLPLPELGALPANDSEAPDTWVLLRLFALLRSGYPAEPRLAAEVRNVLNSRGAYRGQSWAEASLELLLADAIVSRRETGLGEFTEKALERARAVAAWRDWSLPSWNLRDVNNSKLVELLHTALCRSFARKLSLVPELPQGEWKAVAGRLKRNASSQWQATDVPNWESDDLKLSSATRSRGALELGVLLNFICDEEFVEIPRKQCDSTLLDLYRRMPPDFEHPNAWRAFKGDAAFLFMSVACWRETAAGKALQQKLSESLLGVQRLPFVRPRPEASHLATALGWTLAPGPSEDGMGRSQLSLSQRDHLGSLCLALLAASGGLLGDLAPEVPLDFDMLKRVFEALDVLDLEDFYGNMIRTDEAIEKGAAWLLKQQQNNGSFGGIYGDKLGGHAACVLMLLSAEVDRKDPRIHKAMQRMRELAPQAVDDNWFNGTNSESFARHATYSLALMQMAFQKYYEPEQAEAGIFSARTREEFIAAQARAWSKLPSADRTVISRVAWATSNNDGYGWGYGVRKPEAEIPPVTEAPPPPKEGPVTGDKKRDGEKKPAQDGIPEGKFPPRPKTPKFGQHADNSNSQYAVLGLKAAMLLGAPLKLEALAWEAERLVLGFTVLGQDERPYVHAIPATVEPPKAKADPRYADPGALKRGPRARAWLQKYDVGCWSYYAGPGSNTFGARENEIGEGGPHADPLDNKKRAFALSIGMTAAGISSLCILRDALILSKFRDSDLLARIETAMAGGMFMLGKRYPYSSKFMDIDNVRNSDAWWRGADGGPGMLYDMYSCERAGVLTGSRYFANVDWYREGADLLIDKQSPEGSWPAFESKLPGSTDSIYQVVSHCMAVLFLKRAAPPLSQEPPEDKRVYTKEKKSPPESPPPGK